MLVFFAVICKKLMHIILLCIHIAKIIKCAYSLSKMRTVSPNCLLLKIWAVFTTNNVYTQASLDERTVPNTVTLYVCIHIDNNQVSCEAKLVSSFSSRGPRQRSNCTDFSCLYGIIHSIAAICHDLCIGVQTVGVRNQGLYTSTPSVSTPMQHAKLICLTLANKMQCKCPVI